MALHRCGLVHDKPHRMLIAALAYIQRKRLAPGFNLRHFPVMEWTLGAC